MGNFRRVSFALISIWFIVVGVAWAQQDPGIVSSPFPQNRPSKAIPSSPGEVDPGI